MKNQIRAARTAGWLAMLTATCILSLNCLGGQSQKWENVPEAVRATILANGGKSGQVDLESEKVNGQAVYEAVGKDQNGKAVDLVVTADGKLVGTKSDGAAAPTRADAAKAKAAAKALANLKFRHPREITHPFLPLASVKQDILEGKEGGKAARVERTAKPELHKIFKINQQTVDALVFEDRVFEDGQIAEVALDYFAQADDGTVCYLGEDVDEFKDGKVVGHEGAWLYGRDTKIPGVLLPANPKVGDKFRSEDVPKITTEDDEVLSLTETVTVPTGTYANCLKVKEVLSDGKIEFKYYAKGVGCVKEVPADGELVLKVHTLK